MTMRPLGAIPTVLLRLIVFAAPMLGPLSANATEEQATAPAAQEESPPKPETTTTTSSESASSSSHGTIRSEQLEQVEVTGTYIPGVAPSSPVITITSADIENSGASTAGEVLRELGVNGEGLLARAGASPSKRRTTQN